MSDADRKSPRAMLALIALATDLPCPCEVTFYSSRGSLMLTFDRIDDAARWLAFLGAGSEPYVDKTNGRRHVGQVGLPKWHGWQFSAYAAEPQYEIPEEQRADLSALAEEIRE